MTRTFIRAKRCWTTRASDARRVTLATVRVLFTGQSVTGHSTSPRSQNMGFAFAIWKWDARRPPHVDSGTITWLASFAKDMLHGFNDSEVNDIQMDRREEVLL